MLKQTLIAGLTVLALCAARDVRAADDGGFTSSFFSHSASAGLQDPAPSDKTAAADKPAAATEAPASDVAAAVAAASIEPAAGGQESAENVFTAIQNGHAPSGAAQPTVSGNADAGALANTIVFP